MEEQCDIRKEPKPISAEIELPTTYHQIIDYRDAGKWVEFWFADGKRDPERYDACCKNYMFENAIEASIGCGRHIVGKGVFGLWLAWKGDRPILAAPRLTDFRSGS